MSYPSPFNLEGKVALITGTVARVEALGREAIAIECDVSSGPSAAKGAVVNLTRELGLEYATLGIQANAICPRRWAVSPRRGEIRGAAIFLASDASSYMTGQMLVLDGGVLAK